MGAYEAISYKILPLFHEQTEHNLEGKDRSVGTSCRCTDWSRIWCKQTYKNTVSKTVISIKVSIVLRIKLPVAWRLRPVTAWSCAWKTRVKKTEKENFAPGHCKELRLT